MDLTCSGLATRVVAIDEATQVGQARREALALADQCRFTETDAGRVALAATELATNIIKHGRGGTMHLGLVHGRGGMGVELVAIDRGPGFNLAQGLAEGYSTAGSQGLGLGAIRRQAQVMDAWSDARGAIVLTRVYAEHAPAEVDLAYGALRLPMRHETVCGDAWTLTVRGSQLALTMIDGLGHGSAATEAADAGASAAAGADPGPAAELIERVHRGMAGTRGGAAAVACIDLAGQRLQFAGIGNIHAVLCDATAARGLPSHPGIVGVQYRKAQAFDFSLAPGNLVVMHSDGLQGRWNLRDYPGLVHRHPALVVALLQRDFDRGRDDAGIVALRPEAFQ